jgi:predicted transcriptional regulator
MATVESQSPKDQMIAILRNQPDDSSFDELLREIAAVRSIERGLRDADEERTISNEEALLRIKSWQS